MLTTTFSFFNPNLLMIEVRSPSLYFSKKSLIFLGFMKDVYEVSLTSSKEIPSGSKN